MTLDQTFAFLLFAFAAAVTPGPSNIILTSTGATVGVVRGLPALFGVGGGMALMLFLVTFGLGSLVIEHPVLLTGLKWGGAAFLLWLAWKVATAGSSAAISARPIGFWQAAVFQWVNPKSWIICASAAGTFLTAEAASTLVQATALGGLFLVASMPGLFVWLAFGASVQRLLQTERALRIFNGAMGVLLAGSVVLFLR